MRTHRQTHARSFKNLPNAPRRGLPLVRHRYPAPPEFGRPGNIVVCEC
jgi:hypothetical protein